MKTINNYLDDLKEKTGSDKKSAELMEIDRSAISNVRKREQMADETAIKLADLLGIEREEILIAAAIARSKEGEVKNAWVKFAQNWEFKASRIAMLGVFCPTLFQAIKEGYNTLQCILCKIVGKNNLFLSKKILQT